MRADYWLRRHYPSLSRRHIDEALARWLVKTAHGGPLVKGAEIGADSTPDCTQLERHLALLRQGNAALSIPVLLESEELVVVDKPAGIPGHPLSLFETDTVTHWAIATYPQILTWADGCQPTVTPHRLDTDTSGVLLVAKTGAAYTAWRKRFSQKSVSKRYLAWCWGQGPVEQRSVMSAMAHDPTDRRKMICLSQPDPAPSGRVFPALTMLRTLRQLKDRFLCELTMRTGVMHQIRVHMESVGYPLLGDQLYDRKWTERVEQYPLTLLRCTRLQWEDFSVQAKAEKFIGQFE